MKNFADLLIKIRDHCVDNYDDAYFIGPGAEGCWQMGINFEKCLNTIIGHVRDGTEYFINQSCCHVLYEHGTRPDVWHFAADEHSKAVMFRTLWGITRLLALSSVIRYIFGTEFFGCDGQIEIARNSRITMDEVSNELKRIYPINVENSTDEDNEIKPVAVAADHREGPTDSKKKRARVEKDDHKSEGSKDDHDAGGNPQSNARPSLKLSPRVVQSAQLVSASFEMASKRAIRLYSSQLAKKGMLQWLVLDTEYLGEWSNAMEDHIKHIGKRLHTCSGTTRKQSLTKMELLLSTTCVPNVVCSAIPISSKWHFALWRETNPVSKQKYGEMETTMIRLSRSTSHMRIVTSA